VLIKRADADEVAKQAVTLHLGDLEREGAAMIAHAKTRAESILAKGRAERDRLIAGAAERGYKAGYARGHAEGLAKGSETGEAQALEHTSAAISALVEQWGLVLSRFESSRERMISEARADIVHLAAMVAEKVARRSVELDPGVVERAMEAALRRVVGPTALTVVVHPDELSLSERLLPVLLDRVGSSAHGAVVADASVERGGCIVRTSGGGVIDADVRAAIERVVETLLPGPRPESGSEDGADDASLAEPADGRSDEQDDSPNDDEETA